MIAINYQKETSHIKEKHLTKKELSHKALSFVGVDSFDLLFICLRSPFWCSPKLGFRHELLRYSNFLENVNLGF